MKSRRPASGPGAGPLTFRDVAACFFREEWKLLHDWQKELYRSVMKEVHQAFSSLGPLIATSVFSLRPKEAEDMWSEDFQDFEIRTSIEPSSGDATVNSDVVFNGNHNLKGPRSTASTKGHEDSSTEPADVAAVASFNIKQERRSYSVDEPDAEGRGTLTSSSVFAFHNTDVERQLKDYHFPKREENSICPNSGCGVTTTVTSIGINEDGETYPIDFQDCQRRENLTIPSGNQGMQRKKNMGHSFNSKEKSALCKSATKKLKANVVQRAYEGSISMSQMWAGGDQEVGGQKTPQWQSVCEQLSRTNKAQMTPSVHSLETYSTHESTLENVNIISLNPLQSFTPPSGPQREQRLKRNSQIGLQRPLKGKGKYMCTECGKSFTLMPNLIRHERIHTGERPYHCTICGKSFNQKEVLHRHQKMHTGERPYECNECGKCFKRKDHLLGHQKRHAKTQQNAESILLEIV